jgi:hypothetical protein
MYVKTIFFAFAAAITVALAQESNDSVNLAQQASDIQNVVKEITPTAKTLLQTIGEAKKGCWINAQGRGAGRIPPLDCLDGEEKDA